MEDIEVPDDSEETPASPEPEESSAEGETAAPEGEAQAEGEGDQDQGEGKGGPPEEGRGGAFEKLLAKYGGDKDKMAAAYFEQASSNARLFERLQSIEEYIKGTQQQPEADETQLAAEDPNVKEIVKDYNDALAEIESTKQRQNALITKYGALEKKVENLRGQLEQADVDVRAKIRESLTEAIDEQKSVHADIRDTQRDIRDGNEKLKDYTRRYREAEERAKANASRLRQEALERQQEAQATRREFAEAMRKEAVRYGIQVESKQYAVLHQSISDRIYSYLTRLPKGSPGVDIAGAVEALMAEYADTLDLKKKFQRESTAKREATSPVPPKGTQLGKEPPAPKDGRWTKAYVDERAKRMLGG